MPIPWSNYINRSVSRKLVFCIIGIGLIVASTALVVRLVLSYQQTFPLLTASVREKVDTLLPSIQAALQRRDSGLLVTYLARLTSSSEIAGIRITWTNAEGAVSAKTYPEAKRIFKHPFTIQPEYRGPIDVIGSRIESIEFDLSFDMISSELKREGIKNAVIIFLEAVVISFLLIRFMEGLFARHLRDMASYASHLGIDNLHEPFCLKRGENREVLDELDELSLALNNMREQLQDDVRERQVMELSLAIAREEEDRARQKHLAAEATNKAKSQFISTVSHEIRTPMNGILGMIDLLSSTRLNDAQKQYIETIKYSGESLTRVINDILDYSKIEADKLTLKLVPFNLDDLVDECVQLFSAAGAKNNIELYSSIGASTPRHLEGDPTRLRQIILNLLGNAFKFTREGYVYLRVSLAFAEPTGYSVLHFSVSDTGIGINEGAQNELFKPFSQADTSITREFGGTGLGLAIARNLVQLMGGEMGVESEAGNGSCFWFTAKFERSTAPHPENQNTLMTKSVLLVNPNKMFNDTIVQFCQSWQIACKTVFSAREALYELNQESAKRFYDAVLISADLPDCPGLDVASEISKSSDGYKIIIISSQFNQIEGAQDAHFLFLARPVTSNSLKRVLLRAFDKVAVKAASTTRFPQFTDIKVLVAEDNSVNCMVIEGILNKLGVHPTIVGNGELAYTTYICDRSFAVIFMDCEMPVMDGFAATQKIRDWEIAHRQSPVHIVALTAHVESEHKKRVFSSGMDYYLSKPIGLDEISQLLIRIGFQPHEQKTLEI